jgi:ADP-heptose:LPS heptosyltransferase
VCRSVPIAVSLRRAYPEAHIAWLVQDTFADALRSHEAIDELVLFPRGRLRRWWTSAGLRATAAFLRGLRGRFDLVVDAQGLGRSGLMAMATGASRRVGFRDAREGGWLGLTERYEVAARHAVDRMLGLLEAAGIPPVRDLSLRAPPEARSWWAERRPAVRYAVVAPTSRWISKAWPADSWQALVRGLLTRGWERVVCVAGPDEIEAARAALPRDKRVVDLAGATSVGGMMAVIEQASLVVANDSAPLHMAVGFDRPLLALFGPTDPLAVGPYGRDECVLQAPEARAFVGRYRDRRLGDRLMRAIPVSAVLEALDEGRAERGVRTPCEAAR